MSELAKAYEPASVEAKWYAAWEEQGAFRAAAPEDNNSSAEAFSIMIPPPNVTGMLHMGHILNNTLQDIFIRRARLEGKLALWQPGTDHAGIATQTRVEKKLRAEGKTKWDLGREQFVDEVWKWKEEYGGIILKQLRTLGASCDWERTAFTLDEKSKGAKTDYARAVLTSFVKLYEDGYIYRGKRMVNWCPVSLTALSDEEVIMKPQRGKFYKMRYKLAEPATGPDGVTREYLEISTTRPETIMGDTAVAVHPDDERYQHLVGKKIIRPFPEVEIPIVADAAVDKDFGTGCLKVTPAHDQADFDIGKRHNLEVVDILTPDGKVNCPDCADLHGKDRFEARKLAAKKLEEMGLMIEIEDYENNVGFSERADVPIEPRLSEQWFLKYPCVDEAITAVNEKDANGKSLINFHPQRWEKVYLHWLENIQDWCISRQLWWGHRIPVWYKKGLDVNSLTAEDYKDPAKVHVSVDGPSDPENWEQENDVLDTWASSWLWPFATLGWPEPDEAQQRDLDFFYPSSVLVTGFDIIFFWVARMIMAGLAFTNEGQAATKRIPFKDVYITGLIRDEKGRKMSKSLGNSPDPLDLITEYGADGLRFGIVNIAPSGQDILFSKDRIEIGRNFCNKLWNACRFRQMSGPMYDNTSLEAILKRRESHKLSGWDNWIVVRLLETMNSVQVHFKEFEMHQLPHTMYSFFWGDFCDWYVEASKSAVNSGDEALRDRTLAVSDLVIRHTLLLLHPIIPHITEELWQNMGYSKDGSLLQDANDTFFKDDNFTMKDVKYASSDPSDMIIDDDKEVGAPGFFMLLNEHFSWRVAEGEAQEIAGIKEFVSAARTLKAEYNVANKKDVSFFYNADAASLVTLQSHGEVIKKLAGAGALEYREDPPDRAPAAVTPLGTVYLDLASAIDIEAEKGRLSKELDKLEKIIKAGEAKLSNEKFTSKAPANVIQGARDQLKANIDKCDELQRLLAAL